MSIRWKLLALLLAIALVPLVFVAVLDRHGMWTLGEDLARNARESLSQRTSEQLQQLIRNQAALARQQRAALEHTLRAQARAVEKRLARPPPAAERLFWTGDYDRGTDPPPGLAPSDKHYRFVEGERGVPIPVTYDEQVIVLAPGVAREAVGAELACLAGMAAEYRFLYEAHPELIYWQFISLGSGVHTSFPGHGGYPSEYDPRQRDWYTSARQHGRLSWIGPYFDASSEQLILTISMPVRWPDGSFAGVTGLDVTVADVVKRMKPPPIWSDDARSMLVSLRDQGEQSVLEVVARPGYHRKGERWNARFDAEYLDSGDREQMGRLIGDLSSGRSGTCEMPYLGRASLWVYGAVDERGNYLVLIIPYEEVVAQAVAAEQDVLERTWTQLRATGVVAALVILGVLLAALVGSRSVTRPVRELAATADRIAHGEFDARARITTRDELGQLAGHFNTMVPKLQDHLKLKQSLALAMEVQQSLLPAEPPQVKGLDVAGTSIYCDETGGDYYDFVDLSELGPHLLGIAVGDVTGHGVAAAMLMATARAVLRSRATQPASLADLMNGINKCLAPDMAGGRFMTLCYMMIDTRTRQVRWASAGHDPPILYDPRTDSFSELVGGGIPLGVEPSWRYTESGPLALEQGQIMVIGTDGIWEARNPQGKFFGKDALREIIHQNADRPAQDISDAITAALSMFRQESPQEDDVTLIVVKVVGG